MKRTKLIRVISCLLIAMLMISGNSAVKAEETSQNKEVTVILNGTMDDVELVPGTTTHVQVPVKTASLEQSLYNVITKVTVSDGDKGSSAFKIKNVTMIRPNVLGNQNVITFYESTLIEFDVVTKETAKMGQYSIGISFTSMTGEFTANSLSIPCCINKELQPAEIGITKFSYDKDEAVIGNNLDLTLMVKNGGETEAIGSTVSIDYGDSGIKPEYATLKMKIGDLVAGDTKKVTLPVNILPSATKGTKQLKVTFSYKDADGTTQSNETQVYVDVIANVEAPELSFTDVSFEGDLMVGNNFKVIATIKNTGSSKANSVKISLGEGIAADSIMPDFATSSISAGNIKAGSKEQVTVPLKISKDAAKGTKSVVLIATCKDASGVEYTQKTTIYPVVQANEEIKKNEGTPNIVICNVDQTPAAPRAGEQVSISFTVQNKGKVDVNDFKIGVSGLTANTFSPVSLDPYIYIDKLSSGADQRITMTFDVSKSITEGYNTIPLAYSYKYGENNTEESKTATLNVINVVNEQDDLSKSVPKLIISNYSTDVEDLRAGQTFKFTYDIKNTHNSVAAKNIKVTISQADNIFTVTSGSNSSYIEMIKAGETHTSEIELKVKADATTKAYPLTVKMEYEYDGAVASPTTGKVGEEVTETINLQAVENSRPEVENLYLDNWNSPVVGQSSTLNFQFYNMGKSTLSNVYATISGDFQKTDGDKQIIGNVNAGEVEYVEMDVTPLIEGDAKGTVTIVFEDSNGDELSMTQEFTSYIMADSSMDMGMDPGYIDTMGPVDTAKKPILPMWAFIGVQGVLLILATSVTRSLIIKRYKKKLEKHGEEM